MKTNRKAAIAVLAPSYETPLHSQSPRMSHFTHVRHSCMLPHTARGPRLSMQAHLQRTRKASSTGSTSVNHGYQLRQNHIHESSRRPSYHGDAPGNENEHWLPNENGQNPRAAHVQPSCETHDTHTDTDTHTTRHDTRHDTTHYEQRPHSGQAEPVPRMNSMQRNSWKNTENTNTKMLWGKLMLP